MFKVANRSIFNEIMTKTLHFITGTLHIGYNMSFRQLRQFRQQLIIIIWEML